MTIEYDYQPNEYTEILTMNGYNVEGIYENPNSSEDIKVYLLSGGMYAKYYFSYDTDKTNSWKEMKELLSKLVELNLTPKIIKFIDINENSGFIINKDFDVTEKVVQTLEHLHHCGYIHGNVNEENILIDEQTLEVKFVGLDACFHIENPKCLTYIQKAYECSSFDDACKYEKTCLYL